MARIWHGAIGLIAAFALVAQTVVVLDNDRSFVNFVSYFTVQSNILVLIACVMIVASPDRQDALFGFMYLAALAGITVTGIVYATVLAGALDLDGLDLVLDILFHYVVPWATVLGFLVFRPGIVMSWRYLWFAIWPVVWLVYTLVRGASVHAAFPAADGAVSNYPYDFLDVDLHSGVEVTIACVVVTVLMLGLASAYVALTRTRQRSAV